LESRNRSKSKTHDTGEPIIDQSRGNVGNSDYGQIKVKSKSTEVTEIDIRSS
jgi:hypothetical protein